MQRMLPRFALLALSFAVSIALAAPATATSCGDLTKIAPPDATITSATEETGSFEIAEGRPRQHHQSNGSVLPDCWHRQVRADIEHRLRTVAAAGG